MLGGPPPRGWGGAVSSGGWEENSACPLSLQYNSPRRSLQYNCRMQQSQSPSRRRGESPAHVRTVLLFARCTFFCSQPKSCSHKKRATSWEETSWEKTCNILGCGPLGPHREPIPPPRLSPRPLRGPSLGVPTSLHREPLEFKSTIPASSCFRNQRVGLLPEKKFANLVLSSATFPVDFSGNNNGNPPSCDVRK